MAVNADGSVTIRTPGKVAATPQGSGTGLVKLATARPSIRVATVTKQPGRAAAPAKASKAGRSK